MVILVSSSTCTWRQEAAVGLVCLSRQTPVRPPSLQWYLSGRRWRQGSHSFSEAEYSALANNQDQGKVESE